MKCSTSLTFMLIELFSKLLVYLMKVNVYSVSSASFFFKINFQHVGMVYILEKPIDIAVEPSTAFCIFISSAHTCEATTSVTRVIKKRGHSLAVGGAV